MTSNEELRDGRREGETAGRLFEQLLQNILSGEFSGGQPIREARLAREWNVSRTPLREAVRRAAEAGFIVLRPNQAPVIRQLVASDIDAMYDLRALLETHALELAWKRVDATLVAAMEQWAKEAAPDGTVSWRMRSLKFDRKLHGTWTQRCGNKWLQSDLKRQHVFWSVFQTWVGQDDDELLKAYDEHVRLIETIKAGSRDRAVRALRRHIMTSASAVKEALPG